MTSHSRTLMSMGLIIMLTFFIFCISEAKSTNKEIIKNQLEIQIKQEKIKKKLNRIHNKLKKQKENKKLNGIIN
jgi:sensor domain CHASE-containing protein